MRSNVTFFIQENDKINLQKIIEEANKIEDMSEFYQMGINSRGKKVLKAEMEYVKWEEDYPIVEYWNNIFKKLDPKDYVFGKVIIEDTAEDVSKGQYGYISIVKSIDCNVDFEEEE